MDVERGVVSEDVVPVHQGGVHATASVTSREQQERPAGGAASPPAEQDADSVQPAAAEHCDTNSLVEDDDGSGMSLDAQEMLEQCESRVTDSLLPRTTEEVSTQTAPPDDHGPPPYVDIRSPMMRAYGGGGGGAEAADCCGTATALSTPLLDRSPARGVSNTPTPGQCTPLLDTRSEHCSGLGFPPAPQQQQLAPAAAAALSSGGLGGLVGQAPPSSVISASQMCLSGVAPGLAGCEKNSETSSSLLPICRICHMPGELEDEREMLISPCRCAGTLQFIHNTCLQKWLEISAKKSRKPPKCELCHYQYHRHKKFKGSRCDTLRRASRIPKDTFDKFGEPVLSHWRFPRVSRQDKVLHAVFVVNLIIMISCAVATVMCFLSDKGQITKFPRNKVSVITIKEVDLTTEEIITLSCGVLFFVSFFIAMSVQIKAKHTVYQLCVKFVMHNMEWEIDEYDKSKDTMFTSGGSGKNSKQHAAAFV